MLDDGGVLVVVVCYFSESRLACLDRLILAKRLRQKKSETKLNKQSVLVVARKREVKQN